MRAIASDANAHRARRATLPLRLPHRVQDAFAHAFQIPVRAAQMLQLAGQRILDVLVLAAAALQDQLHLDLVLLPLLEVNHRRLFAQIVAAVFSRERIHRIRPQLAAPRGLRDGFANRALHLDLIHANRRVNHKRRHAGVLADGPGILLRHIDVGRDDPERLRGLRAGIFGFECHSHGGAHVRRQIGGSLGDQLDQTIFQERHSF